jgi:hypothetical protein
MTALGCRASYSHAGQYYTLDECANYNPVGLWSFKGIHFSKYGTLMNTIVHLVGCSEEGYFASELQVLLHVRVHNALTALQSGERLVREQMGGQYLYVCPFGKEHQLEKRHQSIQKRIEGAHAKTTKYIPETIQESMRFLSTLLNEQHRRLYLGMESMKLGHGGDARVSQITGINVKTIARGRRELQAKSVTVDRIRRSGAGRPPVKKN